MKAMNLVAASKLQRSKEHMEEISPMFSEIKRIMDGIPHTDEAAENIFLVQRAVKNTALVIITSDRGLCGGYNQNIAREAMKAMKGKNEKLITVGIKGWEYFRRGKKNIIERNEGASDATFYDDAQYYGAKLVDMYRKGEIDEAYVAYTRFETMLSHVPTVEKILPVTVGHAVSVGHAVAVGHDDPGAPSAAEPMEYESGIDAFLEHAVPMYLNVFLYGAMVESAVCEQAARMMSMDSAASNAEEIIEELTLVYNRQRQGIITQELNEIVSGANAL